MRQVFAFSFFLFVVQVWKKERPLFQTCDIYDKDYLNLQYLKYLDDSNIIFWKSPLIEIF